MKINKNKPEELLKEIIKLDPVEFLGVCKVLGVKIYDTDVGIKNKETNVEVDEECGRAIGNVDLNIEPRNFEELWIDLCDTVYGLNRTRRRNLGKIIYAATEKEK